MEVENKEITEAHVEPAEPNAAAIAARKKREENEARKAEREDGEKAAPTRKIQGTQYGGSKQKEVDESVEQIDELNTKTLNSYIGKAKRSRSNALYARSYNNQITKPEGEELRKQAEKRSAGIDTAIKKQMTKEEVEQIEEGLLTGTRKVASYGDDKRRADVRYSPEYQEYQVHHYKDGKHQGEGPVSYHGDDKEDAHNTAKHAVGIKEEFSFSNLVESYKTGGIKALFNNLQTEAVITEEPTEAEFNAELEKAKAKSAGKAPQAEVAKAAVQAVQKEEVESLEEGLLTGTRKVASYGDDKHRAEVRYNSEWQEYQVHHYKDGKHQGEGPVSYHGDDKEDAHSTAKHSVGIKEDVEQIEESKNNYELYHAQYSGAIHHGLAHHASKEGLSVDDDDYHQHVSIGPRKPAKGETVSHHIPAKNAKGEEHMIHMQVYNRGSEDKPYELNTYSSKIPKRKLKESVEIVAEGTEDEHYGKQSKEMQDAINLHLRKGKSYNDAVTAAKAHVKESAEQIEERHLTADEKAEVENNVKGMKKKLAGFKERYGDRAKEVMYATATKQAKED